ncbi:MAG TPA: phosphoglycerate mutase family protein [Thermoanaerobaculia bacterium]|nr:phosphoglycerate mutase family protein [Thermoanaerobaculia bacterium]
MRLVFLIFLLAPSAYADVTTVILVRHAEKASSEDDPPLSEAGLSRANELARALGSTKIDAIYTTQYARTRGTAAPLARRLGIEAVVVTAGKGYAAGLVKRIREEHEGQTVLVVGHSNSTPDVIRALGVADVPAIHESQYDHLFVCTIEGDEEKLLVLRYGAPTP